jgi:hypothetical protein
MAKNIVWTNQKRVGTTANRSRARAISSDSVEKWRPTKHKISASRHHSEDLQRFCDLFNGLPLFYQVGGIWHKFSMVTLSLIGSDWRGRERRLGQLCECIFNYWHISFKWCHISDKRRKSGDRCRSGDKDVWRIDQSRTVIGIYFLCDSINTTYMVVNLCKNILSDSEDVDWIRVDENWRLCSEVFSLN